MSQELSKIIKVLDKINAIVVNLQQNDSQAKTERQRLQNSLERVLVNQDWMMSNIRRLDEERLATFQVTQEHTSQIPELSKDVKDLKLADVWIL